MPRGFDCGSDRSARVAGSHGWTKLRWTAPAGPTFRRTEMSALIAANVRPRTSLGALTTERSGEAPPVTSLPMTVRCPTNASREMNIA